MTALFRLFLVLISMAMTAISFGQIPTGYVELDEDLPCLNKTFSLRVHLNESPDGPVPFDTAAFRSMLDGANEAFSPICVSFEICDFLTIENYRYHSHENNDAAELVDLYGDPNRIDVFIPNLDSVPTTCGRATLNGIGMNDESYVMVVNSCIEPGNGTLTHELGHYFGLYHTFETRFGVDFVDGSTCDTRGDLICDTPADPYIVGSSIEWTDPANPCLFVFPGQDSAGRFFTPHVANAMSYYDSSCGCGFTKGQLQVMAQNCIDGSDGVW